MWKPVKVALLPFAVVTRSNKNGIVALLFSSHWETNPLPAVQSRVIKIDSDPMTAAKRALDDFVSPKEHVRASESLKSLGMMKFYPKHEALPTFAFFGGIKRNLTERCDCGLGLVRIIGPQDWQGFDHIPQETIRGIAPLFEDYSREFAGSILATHAM